MNNIFNSQFLNTFTFFDFVTPKTHFATLLIEFHHNIFVILFFILGILLYFIIVTIYLYSINENRLINRSFFSFSFFKHKGMLLEIIWTIFPALMLFIIAIPSFVLLYSIIVFIEPAFKTKISHMFAIELLVVTLVIFIVGITLNNHKKQFLCTCCGKRNYGTSKFAEIDILSTYRVTPLTIGYKKQIEYKKSILIISKVQKNYNSKLFFNKFIFFLNENLTDTELKELCRKLGCFSYIYTNSFYELEHLTSKLLIPYVKPIRDSYKQEKKIDLFENGNNVCENCHFKYAFLTTLTLSVEESKKGQENFDD